MSHPRFLLDAPLTGPGQFLLGREESHHALNALRVHRGDIVVVFDGLGRHAEALVVETGKAGLKVQVDSVLEVARLPNRLTLATAIPKGKRWQMLIEKCTELGVDRIIPIQTARGVAKGEGDPAKWRRWIGEAAKQSRRAWLPEIGEPRSFRDLPAMAGSAGALLLLADPEGESPGTYREIIRGAPEAVVLVGPEGGFTPEEEEFCRDMGARGICLSPFVLRVETAAAAGCAIVRDLWL